MTPDLQVEEAENFFQTDYLAMYRDSSIRIKKEIISCTCVVARSVSAEFLNRQIIDGFFVEKCRETVWAVRKACVEILPDLVRMT
ncbi:unnamed protein product [Sphagnum balticum]